MTIDTAAPAERAYLVGLARDGDAITVAIINLAHSLKLGVVAEGVETETQLNFLRRHGCDEIQGYYFSAPLAAEACARALSAAVLLPAPATPRNGAAATAL